MNLSVMFWAAARLIMLCTILFVVWYIAGKVWDRWFID